MSEQMATETDYIARADLTELVEAWASAYPDDGRVRQFAIDLRYLPSADGTNARPTESEVQQAIADEVENFCDCDAYRAHDPEWHDPDGCPTRRLRAALDRAVLTAATCSCPGPSSWSRFCPTHPENPFASPGEVTP